MTGFHYVTYHIQRAESLMQLQELWMKSLLQECRRLQSLSGIQVRLFIAHCHPGWDPEAQVCGEFTSAKENMFSKSP